MNKNILMLVLICFISFLFISCNDEESVIKEFEDHLNDGNYEKSIEIYDDNQQYNEDVTDKIK